MLFLLLILLAIWYRLPLAAWMLRQILADAGASPRELKVVVLQPHRAVIAPLEGIWQGQRFHADSIVLTRPDLFSRSLGHVEIRGISVVLDLAALRTVTRRPAAPVANRALPPAGVMSVIAFDDLSIEGRLVLQAPQANQMLMFTVVAKPEASGNRVKAELGLAGPGVSAEGQGSYDFVRSAAGFELTKAQVDLTGWREFWAQTVPRSLEGWTVGGKVLASGQGSLTDGRFAGQLNLALHDGVLDNVDRKISLGGIEGEVVLADAVNFVTKPASWMKIRETRVGDVLLRDAAVRFHLKNLHEACIESAEVTAFGGKVSVEPFVFDPAVIDYPITLRCEGIRVEEILALFPTVRAKATGLADGRVPIHYQATGLSLDHGWVALRTAEPGTLHIDQPGLLTGNLSPQNAAYPTLKAIETGMLNLRLIELHAEIYPLNAPANRSVQIRIAGEPLDANIKAPVSFEVNVNGPVEKLINWGVDSRLKLSAE
ncbi:MAG: YdbH domain-containing protein [Opitutaceae bacterium]|nr:YdbH domain-containing protein [Opitutaceae bacterium]